jgi:hypothetical protein
MKSKVMSALLGLAILVYVVPEVAIAAPCRTIGTPYFEEVTGIRTWPVGCPQGYMLAGYSRNALGEDCHLVVKTDENLKPRKAILVPTGGGDLGRRFAREVNDQSAKSNVKGQDGTNRWRAGPNGSGDVFIEIPISLYQTHDNYYVATSTTSRPSGSETYSNTFVLKLDVNLNLVWGKVYSMPYDDGGNSIIETRDGGYTVVGWMRDTVTAYRSLMMLRLNPTTGDVVWAKKCNRIPGYTADDGCGIVEIPPGPHNYSGYAVVGRTTQSGVTDNFDALAMCTDTFGVPIPGLATVMPGSYFHEQAYSVVWDNVTSSIVTTGQTYQYGPGAPPGHNIFVSKFSPQLVPIWKRAYGWPNYGEGARYDQSLIISQPDNNYVVCGWTHSVGPGAPNSNMLVMKLRSADGAVMWSSVHPSGENGVGLQTEESRAMIQTSLVGNGFAIAGWTDRRATAQLTDCNFHVVTLDSLGHRRHCAFDSVPPSDTSHWYLDSMRFASITPSVSEMLIEATTVSDTPVCMDTYDVGAIHPSCPIGEIDSGETIVPGVAIYNYGWTAVSYPVRMKIGTFYDQTASVTNHPSDSVVYVTFPAYADWPRGTWVVSCSTELARDEFPVNDRHKDTIVVIPPPPETGWVRKADVPAGPGVNAGGCLAYNAENGADYVYALKGNNTCTFYKYHTLTNVWMTKESIPYDGSPNGKKKRVRKGACMATDSLGAPLCEIYAAKGNNTLQWWEYDPDKSGSSVYPWSRKADVPAGASNLKEGASAATVQIGPDVYVYLLKGSGTAEFYRYNIAADTWEPRADAPNPKLYRDGSSIAYDMDNRSIYALKGSHNEFYQYDVATDTWSTKELMPFRNRLGRKKKAYSGAGLAYHNDVVFALKGGNTNEFWWYLCDADTWVQGPDMPPGPKMIRGGGSLAYAPSVHALYALRGNGTFEFWKYGLSCVPFAPRPEPENALAGSSGRAADYALRVSPNPLAQAATIRYSLPKASDISLKLYNANGQLVKILAVGYHPAGTCALGLETSELSAGLYFLRFETRNYSAECKLILE